MKNFVFFDTNDRRDESGFYPISQMQVERRNLAEGDLVTAYMLGEREYWDAKLLRLGDQWGIVLLSDAKEMSNDRWEGQHEGFTEGMFCQKERALRVLESLDLPDELLTEAKRRMMQL